MKAVQGANHTVEIVQYREVTKRAKAVEAELMNNPWNAMYNDQMKMQAGQSAGLGNSVGTRAQAKGGPNQAALDDRAEDRYRWDFKYIPHGAGGLASFADAGTNPFAWVESIPQTEIDRARGVERAERQHHANLIEMKKGAAYGGSATSPTEKKMDWTPTTEDRRVARCKELDAKLGVDKVVLDPMKLQIDTTAWGVIKGQDQKRANKSFQAEERSRAAEQAARKAAKEERLAGGSPPSAPSLSPTGSGLPRARDKMSNR